MIEVRYDDQEEVDEVVAADCHVHLENLSGSQWCLIIETAESRSHFVLRHSKPRGARIVVDLVEADMDGGRSTPLKLAFEYLLPFVHVDVRDKALQIARGEHQPGAE